VETDLHVKRDRGLMVVETVDVIMSKAKRRRGLGESWFSGPEHRRRGFKIIKA
jgi:hypothetical protein